MTSSWQDYSNSSDLAMEQSIYTKQYTDKLNATIENTFTKGNWSNDDSK